MEHIVLLSVMERENEAPAERDFPAGWSEPSLKTCISRGRTLGFEGYAQV